MFVSNIFPLIFRCFALHLPSNLSICTAQADDNRLGETDAIVYFILSVYVLR